MNDMNKLLKRDLILLAEVWFFFLSLIQLYWIRLGMIILLTMMIFQKSWYQVKGLACRTFDTSSLNLKTPWKVGVATMILILQVRKWTLCNTKHRVNLPKGYTARCPDKGHLRNPFQEWNCLWPRGSELGLWGKLPWASVSSSGKWGWWRWCCQYQQRFTELIH